MDKLTKTLLKLKINNIKTESCKKIGGYKKKIEHTQEKYFMQQYNSFDKIEYGQKTEDNIDV